MKQLPYFCIIGSTFLALPSLAATTSPLGPLLTRSQSPLQSLGVVMQTRDAFTWSNQHKEFYLSSTASSVWGETESYHLDYYQNDVMLGYAFVPAEKWKLDIQYLYRFAANNHIDSLTKGFHDLFGLGQNGRDDVPNHSFNITNKGTGQSINNFHGDTLNNAATLYLERSIAESDWQALSFGAALYYNRVDSGSFSNETFEQLLQANYSLQLTNKHYIYSSLGWVHRDSDKYSALGLHLRNWSLNASISYQYQATQNSALFAEARALQGSSQGQSSLSETSYESVLGYRYSLPQGAIEFSILENFINHDNSSDVGFTLSYRHTFN